MQVNALVVDDSGIMRKMVMRTLTESRLAQFTFTEAGDGLEALERFDSKKTDMIFVDWNMPNMSGIDFVRKLRATEKRHVPIVMITTEGTMGKVEEALDDAGADSYVVKPFTAEILQRKLERLFGELGKTKKKSKGFFSKLAG
jgi:two-component system, chemotaxis family, chemotaxis protein CheY